MNEKTDRKEYFKKYAEEHKEERQKRAREYYYNNRKKCIEYKKQRRLKIKNDPVLSQKVRDYQREWARKNRKKQKEIINNLQSKIDKAIEYIENHFIFDDENGEYYQTHTFDKDNAKELHDILKEEKNGKIK